VWATEPLEHLVEQGIPSCNGCKGLRLGDSRVATFTLESVKTYRPKWSDSFTIVKGARDGIMPGGFWPGEAVAVYSVPRTAQHWIIR
jgi:hypothetical protein